MIKLLVVIAALMASSGCGTAVESCTTACDCKRTDAPVRCPGEWACNSGTCEYACKSQCSQLPYTCATNEECNGSVCSARKGC